MSMDSHFNEHTPSQDPSPSAESLESAPNLDERIKGLELYPAGERTLTLVMPGEEGAFTLDDVRESQDVADRLRVALAKAGYSDGYAVRTADVNGATGIYVDLETPIPLDGYGDSMPSLPEDWTEL